MALDSIRYPDDASNTGKREATRSTTEGGNTVHFPRFIQEDNRVRTGVYYLHSGALVVQAAAHGAGAGWLWLINHVGASPLLAVRRAKSVSQHGSVMATPTSPRLMLERFTFTGTASGAQITAAKRRASDATPSTWSLRTANTGMTQTAGAAVHAFFSVAALTAVGGNSPSYDVWEPELDEMVVLAAGEGLRFYQPDAATASDTRRHVLDLIVEEYTEF